MMAGNTRADACGMFEAAYHEVAHCLVANEVGMQVFGATVYRDGGGVSDLGACPGPVADLRVTVAGYVAEAMLEGREPTWEDMQKYEANELDVDYINKVIESGVVRAEIAIPSAMRFAVWVLSLPKNAKRHTKLALTLARRRYLWGQMLRYV
jgi:hypothetical protein